MFRSTQRPGAPRRGWPLCWGLMGLLGGCQLWDSKLAYLFESEGEEAADSGLADMEASDTGRVEAVSVSWTGELTFTIALEGEDDSELVCSGDLLAEELSGRMEGTGSAACDGFVLTLNYQAELDPSGALNGVLWPDELGEDFRVEVTAARTDDELIEAELSGVGEHDLLQGTYIVRGTLLLSR